MILLQTHTRTLLDQAATQSAHGLLLTGPTGAGKGHAARYLALKKLELPGLDALEKHPYVRTIAPENNSISIAQIRDLQRFLQLKTPGSAGIRRIAIIEDAHQMTPEAQNALLKSLEEPPADTVLILTAPATLQLRPTIYSRVQQIPILPISKQQALEHFQTDFDKAAIEKAYRISAGQAGLLHALLHAKDHVFLEEIQRAKTILASPVFARLTYVDELAKQKDALPLFLAACKLIAETALQQVTEKGSTPQTKRWHHALKAIYQTEAALPHNPNAKLLLTDLYLQI